MEKAFTILSIDPGTSCTGISILKISEGQTVHVHHVETIKAERRALRYVFVNGIHGARYAKILAVADRIAEMLEIYKPDVVVSESPYMGRFAQSFGALTELLAEIRNRLFIYDPSMFLNTLEPSVVKKHLGVKGTSGDKNEMSAAVLKQLLSYSTYINPVELDEHSIDSIAVGLCFLSKLQSKDYSI